MHKVTHNHSTPNTIRMSEMARGQYAIIRGSSYDGIIVLKTFDEHIVQIRSGDGWTLCNDIKVEILPKGFEIKITID